jgi:hypothetical protein
MVYAPVIDVPVDSAKTAEGKEQDKEENERFQAHLSILLNFLGIVKSFAL